MAKCSVAGCTKKPRGGFEEIADSSTPHEPGATLSGLRTYWCAEHRWTLEPATVLKRGRRLSAKELED